MQYYKYKSSEAEAEPVSVMAPALVSGIDAALTPGGPPALGPGSAAPTETMPTTNVPGALHTQSTSGPETTLSLVGRRISVARDGDATLTLACAAATTCPAKLTLKLRRLVKVKGKKVLQSITIGKSAILSIAAGKRLTVRIELNAEGRRLLLADHGRLAADLTLATHGGRQDDSVVLVERKR